MNGWIMKYMSKIAHFTNNIVFDKIKAYRKQKRSD